MEGKRGSVYIFHALDTDMYKIGRTGSDVRRRLADCQIGSPVRLTVFAEIETLLCSAVEKAIHATLHDQHTHGEWFRLTDSEAHEVKNLLLQFQNLTTEETSQLVYDLRYQAHEHRSELARIYLTKLTGNEDDSLFRILAGRPARRKASLSKD